MDKRPEKSALYNDDKSDLFRPAMGLHQSKTSTQPVSYESQRKTNTRITSIVIIINDHSLIGGGIGRFRG
jgi:anti-sigma regulatory factor (Ser/Thr protein kinase)